MFQKEKKFLGMAAGLLVLALFLSSCGVLPANQAEQTPEQPTASATPSGPMLRITNRSDVQFQNLTVLFPEEEVFFGDVAPGATTEYLPVSKGVYNYAAYRYTNEAGEEITQPVIDWVGEEPHVGQFTYILDYDPSRPELGRIELVERVED